MRGRELSDAIENSCSFFAVSEATRRKTDLAHGGYLMSASAASVRYQKERKKERREKRNENAICFALSFFVSLKKLE